MIFIPDLLRTSSYDLRYTLSGSVSAVPVGTISGSAQITSLGFVSQSTDITSLNAFTASYFTDSSSLNTKVNDLISHTSSYETTGRGIISESVVTIADSQPSIGVGNLWYDSNNGNISTVMGLNALYFWHTIVYNKLWKKHHIKHG